MRRVLVLVLLLSFACKREDDVPLVRFDEQVKDRIAERTTLAVASPRVSAAFDGFLESVVADPRVARQGDRLANTLMADAKVAGAVETLMAKLVESPRVMAAVTRIVEEHPNASQDEIGDLAGKQFEQRWDTPEVTKAWLAAWDAFLARMSTEGAELAIVYRPAMRTVLSGIDDAALNRRINARLVELNGGSRPDPTRAATLYVDHAWSEARIAEAATKILGNQTVRSATAEFVAGVLAVDAVSGALAQQVSRLAANPDIQAQIVLVMDAIYAPDLDDAALRSSLRTLLTHTEVVKAVRDLLKLLGTNERTRALASAWYETVRKDAALARDLRAFMAGW